jgi:hypothetical protein
MTFGLDDLNDDEKMFALLRLRGSESEDFRADLTALGESVDACAAAFGVSKPVLRQWAAKMLADTIADAYEGLTT